MSDLDGKSATLLMARTVEGVFRMKCEGQNPEQNQN